MEFSDNPEKQKSLDVAESSREAEWAYPSFVAGLFAGSFRWDLIHPYPAQTPEDKKLLTEIVEEWVTNH